MNKTFLIIATIGGLTATCMGAFGAHALATIINEKLLHAYQTGVQYQFYHTLALDLVGCLILRFNQSRWIKASGWLFTIGIILFSGSLYILAISGNSIFGIITPFGGIAFILGWVCLFIAMILL